eukprot:TRINITY_DN1765_c0_g1_i1.p1 TRINITY_DN1765_c0_g1~~TRINITY_DN1765_c0_g1_i1.p1  ORF type:complete len:80 (-),score=13.74 TRINITY_DN1765_c0_g1_i1:144-383(-)
MTGMQEFPPQKAAASQSESKESFGGMGGAFNLAMMLTALFLLGCLCFATCRHYQDCTLRVSSLLLHVIRMIAFFFTFML